MLNSSSKLLLGEGRVFLDTEFTDSNNKDLLSIGLVTEHDSAFYQENLDYIDAWVNPWVRTNVFPLLDKYTYGMKRSALVAKLWEWIDMLPYDNIVIISDHMVDHEIMKALLDEQHPKISRYTTIKLEIFRKCDEQCFLNEDYYTATERASIEVEKAFDKYFKKNKVPQHHALNDAKALKESYMSSLILSGNHYVY